MFGEIITIGDELLIGQVVNTNASWIAQQMNGIGIGIIRVTVVADEQDRITEALDEAARRADLIILTGGLGPTRDDITKQTLCAYFNTELTFDEGIFEHITSLFSGRGLTWNELNRQQAFVPKNCTVLQNNYGTAPGMWFQQGDKVFVSLPGVPYEMKALITETVIPKIVTFFPERGAIVHRTVLTQGIPESVLAERITTWENGLPANIKLAYLPKAGMVRLRLSARGNAADQLNKQIDEELMGLEKVLPGELFGSGEENLEAVVGILLMKEQKTLSTAESCTGGYIAHLITSIPGCSDYYKGSVVAYSNSVKETMLGVLPVLLEEHGAVSEAVVKAMAEGVKKRMGTDYAIATSGVAGPGGGTDEKPVGTTWIAVSTPGKTIAKKFMFGKHRERNIQRTALTALNMLRKELQS